jgi:hypothetical protein
MLTQQMFKSGTAGIESVITQHVEILPNHHTEIRLISLNIPPRGKYLVNNTVILRTL